METKKETVICGEGLGDDIMSEFLNSSKLIATALVLYKEILKRAPKNNGVTSAIETMAECCEAQLANNKAVLDRIETEGVSLQ